MAGTGAGTASGVGFGWAAWGEDVTWSSLGAAFATAFGGAIASAGLSKGWSEATESNTAGKASEAAGKAAPSAERAQSADMMMAKLDRIGRYLAATHTQGWLAENTAIPFVTTVDMPPATSAPLSDEPFCTKVPGLSDDVASRPVIIGGAGVAASLVPGVPISPVVGVEGGVGVTTSGDVIVTSQASGA
jgi:hypothetical protein